MGIRKERQEKGLRGSAKCDCGNMVIMQPPPRMFELLMGAW